MDRWITCISPVWTSASSQLEHMVLPPPTGAASEAVGEGGCYNMVTQPPRSGLWGCCGGGRRGYNIVTQPPRGGLRGWRGGVLQYVYTTPQGRPPRLQWGGEGLQYGYTTPQGRPPRLLWRGGEEGGYNMLTEGSHFKCHGIVPYGGQLNCKWK
jgi:hypothetical protein